jgi:hypothetical protein
MGEGRPREVRVGEVRIEEGRLAELRLAKVRSAEVGPGEIGPAEVGPAEVGLAEVRRGGAPPEEEVEVVLGALHIRISHSPLVPRFHPLPQPCEMFCVGHLSALLRLVIGMEINLPYSVVRQVRHICSPFGI